jgi:hypothetical protein
VCRPLQLHTTGVESSNPRHPLFLQRVWTSGVLLRLKDSVGAGCKRHPISKMTATGVPPHLVLANSIVHLEEDIGVMREVIITKLEQLPEALKQSMLENFQIDGTVPITRHEMHDMMRLSIDDLKKSIETSLNSLVLRGGDSTSGTPVNALVDGGNILQVPDMTHYTTWCWNGDIHPVPEHLEFPV